VVANNLKAYVDAPTRRDKSDIISEVAEQVRKGCHGGGFVRKDKDGQWTEVGPTMAREKVSHAFRDSLLKQNRRRGDGEEKEASRARSWMKAQDRIFSMLHLHSESLRTDRDTEHRDRRASTSSNSTGTGTGTGTSSSTPIQRTRATMQSPRPVAQLYTTQNQLLQLQNQVFQSQIHHGSETRGDPNSIMANANTDNDQIHGNLARGSIFPFSWDREDD
jgi:hypothetical protein